MWPGLYRHHLIGFVGVVVSHFPSSNSSQRVIRDAIYDLVARNRYRWFGRRDACILPNSDRSWPS
jgi:predicted DCC family thiol-disulfide oxidoreductase YuxK